MNKVQTFVLLGFFALFLSGFFITQNLSMTSDGLPILAEPQVHEEFVISSGESWLSGWSYRQQITITGQTGAGTYYQIRLPFNYDAAGVTGEVNFSSHCQTDFGDIRLTDNDGDTELDYWIEEKTDSDDGLLWVEVADSLESGTVVIYIYYGTSGTSTTTSDGANTFLLFDDFDDGTIDTDIWTVYAGDLTETGGNLVYTGTTGTAGSLISDTAFSTGIASRTRAWGSNDDLNSARIFGSFVKSATDFGETADQWSANVNDRIDGRTRTGGSSYNTFAQVVSDYTTAYVYEIQWASTVVNFIQGTSTYKTASSNLPTGDMIIYQNEANSAGDVGYQDWFLIRKFVAIEPYISTISAEEEADQEVTSATWDNLDSGDMFAFKRIYTITTSILWQTGTANIVYVNFTLLNDADAVIWRIHYNHLTTTFSETIGGTSIQLETGSCSITDTGDTLDLTAAFYITWTHPDAIDEYHGAVLAVESMLDGDWDQYIITPTDEFTVETRLDLTSYSLSDGAGVVDRGDYDTLDGITATGTVVYHSSSVFVPSDVVDVFITCADIAGSPWSDTTLSSGVFSMTVDSDDVVGLDTYTFLVVFEGTGVGGTNYLYTSTTDTYIADRIIYTATSTESWLIVGESTTITLSAKYAYPDGNSDVPSVVWSNTDSGSVSYATVGVRNWYYESSGDTYGITSITNTSATCTWDKILMSSGPAYKWTQYSPDEIWLIVDTAKFTWSLNGSNAVGAVVQSSINGTDDDWGIVSSDGYVGDMVLGGNPTNGAFDSSWYYAVIALNIEIGGYDWEIWTKTLSVDILHSIHIEDSTFYLTDNWVTMGFNVNWNNGTFYVYDNGTYVGGAYNGGLYQFAKSNVVGLHNLTVIVNGTQGTISNTSQDYTGSSSDGWKVIVFKYTVNPITFTISQLTIQQNNDTIVISGWFITPNTTLTWVLVEDGVGTSSGSLVLTASGEYNSITWTKNDPEGSYDFLLTITADGSDIRIHGYSIPLDSSSFIGGSFFQEGDTYYQTTETESSSFLFVFALIVVAIMIPVAIGLGFGIKKYFGRTKSRDKTSDIYRTKR